eukprot:scaffold3838_cov57-Attheya_sp.AAC.1
MQEQQAYKKVPVPRPICPPSPKHKMKCTTNHAPVICKMPSALTAMNVKLVTLDGTQKNV